MLLVLYSEAPAHGPGPTNSGASSRPTPGCASTSCPAKQLSGHSQGLARPVPSAGAPESLSSDQAAGELHSHHVYLRYSVGDTPNQSAITLRNHQPFLSVLKTQGDDTQFRVSAILKYSPCKDEAEVDGLSSVVLPSSRPERDPKVTPPSQTHTVRQALVTNIQEASGSLTSTHTHRSLGRARGKQQGPPLATT